MNNKKILLGTVIFALVYFLLQIILDQRNLQLLHWVKCVCMAVVLIGVIVGTILTVGKLKKEDGKVLAIIGVICIVMEIFVAGIFCIDSFLLSDRQEVVVYNDTKMVKETHTFLLSNWIKYYDYKNPFVISENERIYEAYDDSLYEYLYTIYFDEEGNVVGREEK